MRGGGILQRTGWQPWLRLLDSGRWQGGFIYEPDSANPYLVCSVDGHIYQVLLEAPYTITDLSVQFNLFNPSDAEQAFFCQGENILVIQAGDYGKPLPPPPPVPPPPSLYNGTVLLGSDTFPSMIGRSTVAGDYGNVVGLQSFTVSAVNVAIPVQYKSSSRVASQISIVFTNYYTPPAAFVFAFTPDPAEVPPATPANQTNTLPLFWNGTTLRRSIGINTIVPSMTPGVNEIPAAEEMWYHADRLWYAQARKVSAGDIVGGPSGTAANHFRDSIISVTENPLCVGGDGFSIPTNAGNIRALREENNLNESVANSRLLIWTRKMVFALSIPVTRNDWINANSSNQPLMVPVQRVNGTTSGRSVVAANGDWFYQSPEPGVRSLITAVRQYNQWGNTPISQNEQRVMQVNDRSLMRFSGGIVFDNRMLQLFLPRMASDGVNVVHQAITPLDFDIVSNLNTQDQASNMIAPVWEGAHDGLPFLQLFEGDFGGLHRAFALVISEDDGSINVWELTQGDRRENGDNRVTWGAEFPAFTWSTAGLEFALKQLKGGELWVDKVYGKVDIDVYYREDADPCWRRWFHTDTCAARDCLDQDPICVYPYSTPPYREGYKFNIPFPEPPSACDSMGVRPTTIGYQFQVKIILKGWCRIRGLILYAMPHTEPQYHGLTCSASAMPNGMSVLTQGRQTLPNPFLTNTTI